MQKKQVESLYQLVKVEHREIESFLEVIAQREKYEQLKLTKMAA